MRNNLLLPELLRQLAEEHTEKVKLAVTDIDGILRGKVIAFDKLVAIAEKGFGFCDVVFGWDAEDRAYDNGAFTGWHTGYPDALAVIDPGTFRRVPWESDIPFCGTCFGRPLVGYRSEADHQGYVWLFDIAGFAGECLLQRSF